MAGVPRPRHVVQVIPWHVTQFILLQRVDLTFQPKETTLNVDRPNESCEAVFSCGGSRSQRANATNLIFVNKVARLST